MASTHSLYISARELPAEVLSFEPAAKIALETDGTDWVGARIELDGVRLELDHRFETEYITGQRDGFCNYVMNCKQGKMDQSAFDLIQYIQRTQHIVHVRIEPEANEVSSKFLRQLQEKTKSIGFVDQEVVDVDGYVLVGPLGTEGDATLPQYASAVERKARSDKRAKECGLTVITSLPGIVADEEVFIRSPLDVARRAICLCAVAVRGEGLELEQARQIIEQWELWDFVTPKEKAFLETEDPSRRELTQFVWQYECVWVLGWALGVFDELPAPTKICDVPRLAEVMVKASVDSLSKDGFRRTTKEILDEADFIYRAHWAVTEQRMHPKVPVAANLEPGVVLERHRALNWLTSYQNSDWDDVLTDT